MSLSQALNQFAQNLGRYLPLRVGQNTFARASYEPLGRYTLSIPIP